MVRNVNNESYIEILQNDTVVETIEAVNDIITINEDYISDALSRKIFLRLFNGDGQYGGDIKFLPENETETWIDNQYINENGDVNSSGSYSVTDFVDIRDVTDIVFTGQAYATARAIAAYDDNQEFVKLLLTTGSFTNVHIEPDGTYRFIRACSTISGNKSLVIYYPV